jgi:hypothetical protein
MYKLAGFLLAVAIGLSFKNPNPAAGNAVQRATTGVVENATGTIHIVHGDEPVYIINCASKYLRLHILNLPVAFQKAGKQVQFSGCIKATLPLEDDYGTYFEITDITEPAVAAIYRK